jgi:hypothetical protein
MPIFLWVIYPYAVWGGLFESFTRAVAATPSDGEAFGDKA